MNYPNKARTSSSARNINAARRGMSLEEDINYANKSYLLDDRAVIHKKPTPITLVKVDYPKRSAAKITEAYFKLPSTTDYNGIYKGKYIDFEAKECRSTNFFPFSSIHEHQIKHLEKVIKHGAIAFLILRMSLIDTDYLIKAEDFLDYYSTTSRKSLPLEWITSKGYKIDFTYHQHCNYLDAVDEAFDI